MQRWSSIFLGAMVSLIAACSTMPGEKVKVTDKGVSVSGADSLGEAQMVAEEVCAKRGKVARWTSGDAVYEFECVE
jgi:hypothetical protein